MSAKGHNVYILGAGFSAFADMPCIDDFLEKMQDLAEFSDRLSSGAKRSIKLVLNERALASSVREKVQVNLDNIEQLFSLIDASASSAQSLDLSEEQKAVRKAISATLLGSASASKTIHCGTSAQHADEVARDIPGASTDGSLLRVDPYRLFAAMLAHRLDEFDPNFPATDTVISFNYDLVLEEAFRSISINPDYTIPAAEYPSSLAPNPDSPKLIKLHGSINWGLSDPTNKKMSIVQDPSQLIDAPDKYPILLPPTWNKGAFVQALGILWFNAIQALRIATRIVLIGYSMPDTDIHFRYFLASGLRDNHSLRSFVIINPSDLKPQYKSFFDKTYFQKRLVSPGLHHIGRNSQGYKFEELIGMPPQFADYIGRCSKLRPSPEPQNNDRLTNGNTALAHWIGSGGSKSGSVKSARSIARRREMELAIAAARNGVLPKRYVKMATRTI